MHGGEQPSGFGGWIGRKGKNLLTKKCGRNVVENISLSTEWAMFLINRLCMQLRLSQTLTKTIVMIVVGGFDCFDHDLSLTLLGAATDLFPGICILYPYSFLWRDQAW